MVGRVGVLESVAGVKADSVLVLGAQVALGYALSSRHTGRLLLAHSPAGVLRARCVPCVPHCPAWVPCVRPCRYSSSFVCYAALAVCIAGWLAWPVRMPPCMLLCAMLWTAHSH